MNKKLLLKTVSTWDNEKFKGLNLKNPEVSVVEIEIGVGESLQMHKHDMVNVAYVKRGTLTIVTDNNDEKTFHAGESFAELIEKYHYGKNTGVEPVELVVFYIGEKGTPLSVNK